MRAVLLLLVAISAAACGEGSSSKLVSADASQRDADGCVAPDARSKRSPKTWLVREGDSLRRIARKVYGDENLWKAIADANPGKVGRETAHEYSIQAGVELTIPYDGI